MKIGFRFGLGPLFVYIPLAGGKRRNPNERTPTEWFILALLILLFWPYMIAMALGAYRRWDRLKTNGIGLTGTAAWLLVLVIIHSVMNGT